MKLRFMAWCDDSMLRTGHQLEDHERRCQRQDQGAEPGGRVGQPRRGEAGSTVSRIRLSRALNARVIVTTFSHEKLPLSTSQPWVTIIPRRPPERGLGREQQERHDQLRDVVGGHLHPVQRRRQAVEPPAERVRHRLGLVVVVEAGQAAASTGRLAA